MKLTPNIWMVREFILKQGISFKIESQSHVRERNESVITQIGATHAVWKAQNVMKSTTWLYEMFGSLPIIAVCMFLLSDSSTSQNKAPLSDHSKKKLLFWAEFRRAPLLAWSQAFHVITEERPGSFRMSIWSIWRIPKKPRTCSSTSVVKEHQDLPGLAVLIMSQFPEWDVNWILP